MSPIIIFPGMSKQLHSDKSERSLLDQTEKIWSPLLHEDKTNQESGVETSVYISQHPSGSARELILFTED